MDYLGCISRKTPVSSFSKVVVNCCWHCGVKFTMLYLSFSFPISDTADTDSEDNADMGMNTHRSFIPPTHR